MKATIPANDKEEARSKHSKALERAECEIFESFKHSNLDHPMMQELRSLCLERRCQQLLEQQDRDK